MIVVTIFLFVVKDVLHHVVFMEILRRTFMVTVTTSAAIAFSVAFSLVLGELAVWASIVGKIYGKSMNQ